MPSLYACPSAPLLFLPVLFFAFPYMHEMLHSNNGKQLSRENHVGNHQLFDLSSHQCPRMEKVAMVLLRTHPWKHALQGSSYRDFRIASNTTNPMGIESTA